MEYTAQMSKNKGDRVPTFTLSAKGAGSRVGRLGPGGRP